MQQNILSVDVRIHHRILDAQKHLLHTLAKLKKKTFDNQIIELTMKKTLKSCQTSIKSNLRLQHGLNLQEKFLSLDVRIHHRIWDAQKHLLHTLVKLNKKTFHNQIIKLTMKKTFKSCQTSIKLNLRLQQMFEFATKVPFTRCENSSQNLGCSKTSTSHSCTTEQKDF